MTKRGWLFLTALAIGALVVTAGVVVARGQGSPSGAPPAQSALGTGFTYQGRLDEGGTPANDSSDPRFILFDGDFGGAQVGSIVALEDVAVTNGLLTEQTDGTDCAVGSYARGVDASGNVQGCPPVDLAGLIARIEALESVIFGGSHVWSKGFGGTDIDIGLGIAVDGSGDVVVTGLFQSTVNFGGGNITSSGGDDIFVAKLSGTDGSHVWSKGFGGTDIDIGSGIAVDGSGDVVVTGQFTDTVNFGDGNITSSGPRDIFVAKLSGTDGSHVWSKGFGGIHFDTGGGIAVDGSGDVVVIGRFIDTVNFGGDNITSSGAYDIFVAKLSGTDGSHVWSKGFGGTFADQGGGIAVDGSSDVVVTGHFQGTVNFGGDNFTSSALEDIFVAKFSGTDGSHVWSKGLGGNNSNGGWGIAVDGRGDVVVTGYFSETVNFGGDNITSSGRHDVFVAKFSGGGACGDLNGDGDVNVFDAIIDLQIIVGLITPTEAQLTLGDVVRDSTINVFDAILLLQHIVGLTEITECGPPVS